jgi:hypothetical protein
MSKFPIFEPSQVLTAKHLNDLREYLDGHARETRRWTIGTGIVAGLQLGHGTLEGQPVLNVACGAGISSSGLLLTTEGVQLGYAQLFEDRGRDERFGSEQASEGNNKPKTWLMKPDVWQMMATADVSKVDKPADQDALRQQQREDFISLAPQLEERVVVAYLECWEVDLQFCSLEECTERGQTGNAELRFLLVPKSYVEDPGLVEDENTASLVLEIPRVTAFKSLVQMRQRYVVACRTALGRFMKVLTDRGLALLDKLGLDRATIVERVQALQKQLNRTTGGVEFIQVVHDFMRDLAATWNSLVEQAVATGYQSCPELAAHPRHLCLGRVGKRGWRHDYRGPLAHGGGTHGRDALVRTHRKLLLQLEHFHAKPPSGPIMLLGQDGLAPCTSLVPYYYDPDVLSELKQVWAPTGLRATFPATQVHSWHDVLHGARPLYSHHDDQQFYRVEGILGTAPDVATLRLDRLRTLLQLSFDVVALDDGASLSEAQLTVVAEQRDMARRWNAARRAIGARLLRLGALLDVAQLRPELAHAALLPSGVELRNAIEAVEAALAGPASTRAERGLRGPERALMSAAARMLAGLSRSARRLTSEALTSKIALAPGPQPSAAYLMHVGLLLAHHRAELLRVFEDHAAFDELVAVAALLEREAKASPELLRNFVARHPDLEHGAGVPRGGTFVFVHDGEQVMADFYLPYRWCRRCDVTRDVEVERCIPMVVEAGWANQLTLLDGMISGAVSVWSDDDARWIELGESPVESSWGGRVRRSERGVLVYPIGDARAWAGGRYEPQLVSGSLVKGRTHASLLEPLELAFRVVGDDGPIVYRVWLVLLPPLVLAHDDVAVTVEGKPVEIRPLANDLLPPGRHTVRWTSPPSHGKLTAIPNELGAWCYTPTTGFTGLDEFRYELRVQGPTGAHASSARVTIRVLECCEEQPIEPQPTAACEIELSRTLFCDDDDTVYEFRTRGTVVKIEGPGVSPVYDFDLPSLHGYEPRPFPKPVDPPKIVDVSDWFEPVVDGHAGIREVLDELTISTEQRDKVIHAVDELRTARLDDRTYAAAIALADYSPPQVLSLARVEAAQLGSKVDDLRVLERVRESDDELAQALSKLAPLIEPADLQPLLAYAQDVDHAAGAGVWEAAQDWKELNPPPTPLQRAAVDALEPFKIDPEDHDRVSAWVELRSTLGDSAKLDWLTQLDNLGLSDGDWETAATFMSKVGDQLDGFVTLARLDTVKQADAQRVIEYQAKVQDPARTRLIAAAAVGAGTEERAAILASTTVEQELKNAALIYDAEQLVGARAPTSQELMRYEQALALGDRYAPALALARKGFGHQSLATMRSLASGHFTELSSSRQLSLLSHLRSGQSHVTVPNPRYRPPPGEYEAPYHAGDDRPPRPDRPKPSSTSGHALPKLEKLELPDGSIIDFASPSFEIPLTAYFDIDGKTVADLSQLVRSGDLQPTDLIKAQQLGELPPQLWSDMQQIGAEPDATRRATLETVTLRVPDPSARASFWASMKFTADQRAAVRAAAGDYTSFGSDIQRETTAYVEARHELTPNELTAIDGIGASVDTLLREQVVTWLHRRPITAEQLRRGVAASRSGELAVLRRFKSVDGSFRELLASAYASGLGRERILLGLTAAKVSDEYLARIQQGEEILGRIAADPKLVTDALVLVASKNRPTSELTASVRGAKHNIDDALRQALRVRFKLEPLPPSFATHLDTLDPLRLFERQPETWQTLWWLIHESPLDVEHKHRVFEAWKPSTLGIKPQRPVGSAVGAGTVVIGDMALPIDKIDIDSLGLGDVDLGPLGRADLRFRLRWQFVPSKAKAGEHEIRYECLGAKGVETTEPLKVRVLAHPQITIRDTLVRKEDKYVVELQAHDALDLLGKEGKDGWQLEWQLPDGKRTDRPPTVELGKRPDSAFQYDYQAELVHPRLPDCRAVFPGRVRWPQARPDLLREWLGGAKERLDRHVEQLTDELDKVDVETARDVTELVGTLLQTQGGEDQWARSDLDRVVLPQFERTLTRLRNSSKRSRATTLAEAYADTVDAALGFVQATGNAPTEAADKLLTLIEQDVGANESLKTEQLRTRLTELRDDPDANPKLVERAHVLLKEWPDH